MLITLFANLFFLMIFYLSSVLTTQLLFSRFKIKIREGDIFVISPFFLCFISFIIYLITNDIYVSIIFTGFILIGILFLNKLHIFEVSKKLFLFVKKNLFIFMLSIIFSSLLFIPFIKNQGMIFYAGFGTDAYGYLRVSESISNKSYRLPSGTIPQDIKQTNPELGWVKYVEQVGDRPLNYFNIAFVKIISFSSIYLGYFLFTFLVLFVIFLYFFISFEDDKIFNLIRGIFLFFFLPLYGLILNQYIARFYSIFILLILSKIILDILILNSTKKIELFLILWIFFVFIANQSYDTTLVLFFMPCYFIYYFIELIKNEKKIKILLSKIILFLFASLSGLFIFNTGFIKFLSRISNLIHMAQGGTSILFLFDDYKFYKNIDFFFITISVIILVEITYFFIKRKISFYSITFLYLLTYVFYQILSGRSNYQPTYYMFAYFSTVAVFLFSKYRINLIFILIFIVLFFNSFYLDRILSVTTRIKESEIGQISSDETALKSYLNKNASTICINKTEAIRTLSLFFYLRDIKKIKISQYPYMYIHMWRFFYTKSHSIDDNQSIKDYNAYLNSLILKNAKCSVVNDTKFNSKINVKSSIYFGRYQIYTDFVSNLYKPIKL